MKEEIYKELENLDSALTKYKKDDIYNTSGKYFDEMQKSVFSKLEKEERSPKIISFGINKWMMGIAASLLILIVAFSAINQNPGDNKQLAENDIIEYLNIYVDDLDETVIASYLDSDDINLSSENSINPDELENYLENNIDEFNEEELQQLF